MNSHQQGIRAALTGVLVNILLAITKILAGVLGNSYALIADGIESTSDILSSMVVMGGMHISARPADEDHPYGHGKAEPLAGVVVAALLLVAAGWIAVSSVIEIRNPHHAPAPFTLAVLAMVVALKEILSRRVLKVGDAIGSTAVRGDAWHHRSDALTSAAAFLGISVALIGGAGFESADDWAALAACGVIVFNGIKLLRESVNDLMDATVPTETLEMVRQVAASVNGVVAIEKCRMRKTGLELAMDIHVIVNGDLTVRAGHAIAHEVKDRLLAADRRIADVLVHVEPHDAEHGPQRRSGAEDEGRGMREGG
ncbi:MAG: cation transporter [Verrucomicrobiales bacterium]|nr:cation transporter [Verrucomicrobiales bacterium]